MPAVAPPAFPTVTINTTDGPVTVICELVTDDIVITPDFGMDAEFRARLDGGFMVTHRATGCALAEGPGCLACCRAAAKALAALPIDWSELTADNGPTVSAGWPADVKVRVAAARAVSWGCDAEDCTPGDLTKAEAEVRP